MKKILIVAAVYILQQYAMLAAAWPSYFAQTEQEEKDNKEALYDPNMFEGDIDITLDELVQFYGGPKMDELGNVSLIAAFSEFTSSVSTILDFHAAY